jgi:lipopolysaccharide export system protein LptC
MLTKKRVTILFTLLIILLFSAWLIITSHSIKTTGNKPQTPDAFMTEITAVQFNKLGKLNNTLTSPKLVHYQQEDTTLLDTPYIIHYVEDEPPWHISAKHGKAVDETTKIILWEKVKFHQPPGPNSHNTTLLTSKMTYYPKKSFAETDAPVTIIQPGTIVHSIGLQADLNKVEITLLSQVRGQYDKALASS